MVCKPGEQRVVLMGPSSSVLGVWQGYRQQGCSGPAAGSQAASRCSTPAREDEASKPQVGQLSQRKRGIHGIFTGNEGHNY